MKLLSPVIATHGGAGTSRSLNPQCELAAWRGYELMLQDNNSSYHGSVQAVMILEDDGRFNAGRGADRRLDGKPRMDASVMTKGKVGAVIGLTDVRHPSLVAMKIADDGTFVCLHGEGAKEFARLHKFRNFESSETANQRYNETIGMLSSEQLERFTQWDFQSIPYEEPVVSDTVGAVAWHHGISSVTLSTGGWGAMPPGRVGDVAFFGRGSIAGKHGAVAMTGKGEVIVRWNMATKIYHQMASGMHPEKACQTVINRVSKSTPIGAIAVSGKGFAGTYCNVSMACAMIQNV